MCSSSQAEPHEGHKDNGEVTTLFHLQVKECTQSGLYKNSLVSLKVQCVGSLHAQLDPSTPRIVQGQAPLLFSLPLGSPPGWLHPPAGFPMPTLACISLSVERDCLFPKSSAQSPAEALISARVIYSVASPVAQQNPPAKQETWVWSLGQEDPLEKGMAMHSSIPAWEISRTEESGGL